MMMKSNENSQHVCRSAKRFMPYFIRKYIVCYTTGNQNFTHLRGEIYGTFSHLLMAHELEKENSYLAKW